MIRFKKKLAIGLSSFLVLSLSLISVTYASGTKKMLEAWYGAKIIYNNQELVSDVQPFIVNGTTYVPLRMLMSSLNKEINWDDATKKVIIKDKPNETEVSLRTELAQKNVLISDLQAKINELEDKSKVVSLSSLEKTLNTEYDSYENKDFEISLSGDASDVSVKILVSSTDWNDLSIRKRLTSSRIYLMT